jgi:hypothetical protein
MILPDKYVPPQRSMLGLGASLLVVLRRPQTITALWERVRVLEEFGTFERFVLALDFLYLLGLVEYRAGLLRKRKR